jgi:GT2 family glycosyltransferase
MAVDKALAILVPAYKKKYLGKTLDSLFRMEDIEKANIYIFDDSSPEDLSSVCAKFKGYSNYYYYRFNENLGGKCLAQHWNRCIERTSEEWVWLFSDDDLVDRYCIKDFFDSLEETKGKYNLYRFNTKIINEESKTIKINSHPTTELAIDYIKAKLVGKRLGFVTEFIFRRSIFVRQGGFINFPLAWNSDDATWLMFSENKPIYTISKSFVYWRKSNDNISAARKEDTLMQS